MPHCFFILARLFVRVDNVLFRIHDIRIYHAFGTKEVIREISGMEADYETVKSVSFIMFYPFSMRTTDNATQRLETPADLSPLTDQNFVSE